MSWLKSSAHPTSASGIIVLSKTPQNVENSFPTLLVKTTDFQLVFNLSRRVKLPYLGSIVR